MKPSEDEGESRLMKPIGYDGTKRKIYVDDDKSLVPNTIHTLDPVVKASNISVAESSKLNMIDKGYTRVFL